ncbi:histidine kinase [Cytophagaceae bacterium DM2B3-1]|uniref:Histidine kinase n=1 Tax=Xanthocytophaga flava TaxID=3048013 RepID=A0ABT7CEP2_9BACT|nr:histidine kinase [Xanthocytophaga flavus]MDJ1469016.1 histidine kinase [Xanthocytophaga flavus]MDJ1492194.1 histidine kinase [Xanthocytophaga flavus]
MRSLLHHFKWRQVLPDIIFWLAATLILTLFYRPTLPSYGFAFRLVLLVMPINILYYYVVVKWLLPQFLYKKRYVWLNVSILGMGLIAALFFRLNEILLLYPLISDAYIKAGWTLSYKIHEPFLKQLTDPVYIVNAIEQSNIIVWIALGITFFRMWFERRQAAMEAELNLLKAQVHPHFLFNTLNNLYSLTLQNSPQSPAIVLGLSAILRYMLYECNAEFISLAKEVRILESYMELENIRYKERLDLNFTRKGDLSNQEIAPLLLMPLVENAFKHGASQEMTQAWINIDLQVKSNKLKFKVSNSIPDKDLMRSVESNDILVEKDGIGLANIQKRLEIIYPSAHRLRVFEEEDMFLAILEVDLDKRVGI